jgi:transposase
LIHRIVDDVLVALDTELKVYATAHRPTIPPERVLCVLLLQTFYTIPSDEELMEQLGYNLLYRWFLGLRDDERTWTSTEFLNVLGGLLDAEAADRFLHDVLNNIEVQRLLSDKHFSVDVAQFQAWGGIWNNRTATSRR